MVSALLLAALMASTDAPAAPAAPQLPVAPVAPSAPVASPSEAARVVSTPESPVLSSPAEDQRPPPRSEDLISQGSEKPAAGEDHKAAITPPSLTKKAFDDEVKKTSRRPPHKRLRVEDERARLEKLVKEIAATRTALKEETTRLEELAKRPPPPPPPPVQAAPAQPEKSAVDKASVDALSRTLKGMRPEPAAAVVTRLDRKLAVEILRRLRPADAAAIAEKLKPELAAELFSLVARSGTEEKR